MFYIHKYSMSLEYGGPEEGGWWYDAGIPVEGFKVLHFTNEDEAYKHCRCLNEVEHKRQQSEEDYDYYSVLAPRSNHYSYQVTESSIPESYPQERPYYC